MPLIYEKDIQITFSECDAFGRMTPGAALRRIQEIATEQCERLGFDDAFYQRTGTVFLLSRLSLQISAMPGPAQPARLKTRAYGMRRAVFHRVTGLYGPDGALLCEADSRWVLVDTATRRIMRKPLDDFLPYFNEDPAEAHDMEPPRLAGEPQPLGGMQAAYSLCDGNGHINNSRYADLVCDRLPLAALEQAPPRKLLLFYRSEIPLGQDFSLYTAQAEGGAAYYAAQQDAAKNFECWVWL